LGINARLDAILSRVLLKRRVPARPKDVSFTISRVNGSVFTWIGVRVSSKSGAVRKGKRNGTRRFHIPRLPLLGPHVPSPPI